LSEEDRISHQGLTAQVTIELQLHQDARKKRVYPCLAGRQVFFLDFFVLFYQEKSTEIIFTFY